MKFIGILFVKSQAKNNRPEAASLSARVIIFKEKWWLYMTSQPWWENMYCMVVFNILICTEKSYLQISQIVTWTYTLRYWVICTRSDPIIKIYLWSKWGEFQLCFGNDPHFLNIHHVIGWDIFVIHVLCCSKYSLGSTIFYFIQYYIPYYV